MSSTESYCQHLETLDRHLGKALESSGHRGKPFEAVLFHSGSTEAHHRDDEPKSFRPSAHFRRWVPPLDGPEHVVLAGPGQKPQVVRVRPRDYWYDTSPPPQSYWEEAVDLFEVESFARVKDELGTLANTAYVGPSAAAAEALGLAGAVEPDELMAPLDWYRAYKTEHEIALLRVACENAARGHEAARKSFKSWGTEREIHWAYMKASDQIDTPYGNIVALDAKSAILHYQHKRGEDSSPAKVLLLDAGASSEGYASDITRTWAMPDCQQEFLTIVDAVDRIERDLVAMVTPGRPYLEIHLESYRRVTQLLIEVGILKTTVDEAVERGITSAFFPHGVGHQLGLQVHDVGGHQAGPEGGETKPPAEHPFLRNTRILEPGHVVTVEPGLYFIEMLLEKHRNADTAGAIDWALVDRLAQHGGVRIEDNVVCNADGPDDLTRSLIAGPGGE